MIRVEKINVKNYRKFRDEDFYLDRFLTALAGANNAGKTSIVELMSNLFLSGRALSIDDMNYNARKDDVEALKRVISDSNLSEEEMVGKLVEIRKNLNKITVLICIQYDEDDEIRLFSNYLSDIDERKRNYYFVVEYGYRSFKAGDVFDVLRKRQDVVEEFFSSLETSIYYCNEAGEDRVLINNKDDFYNLFNFHCVYALRRLSDTSEEKQHFLSKHLLKTVKNNKMWKNSLDNLILEMNNLLVYSGLSNKIDEITINTIKDTLDEFSKTNGGNTGRLGIDFKLDNQDIEKVLLGFTKIYFEHDRGGKIKEQKQGLGYSNLIYLLLETELFRQKYDKEKVNLLVFEEPEAHLHPQMENIFIHYLNRMNSSKHDFDVEKHISDELKAMGQVDNSITEGSLEVAATSSDDFGIIEGLKFQLFITTHSSEMAKSLDFSSIRVLRPVSHIESKVFNLEHFLNTIEPEERSFYVKFFQFNMIEMIFADKLIMFEGDAERLLLKYVISSNQKFKNLLSEYISYIQVRGAYAHNYLKLINFLQIKTLILSDVDYSYDSQDFEKDESALISEVLKSKTTNKTVERITGKNVIKDIFEFQRNNKGIFQENQLVCLKYQTDIDGYARTLEDAILHRLLNLNTVFTKMSKKDFSTHAEKYHLQMTGPKNAETSIRDRVDKLQKKTDFMYSLIENDLISNLVPKYIEEGLEWLQG